MGLDMYLMAKRFIWTKETELKDKIRNALPCPFSDDPEYVIYEAAYWRKANHIHKWFVDNVQDGNDDCGHYYVDKEQLEELRDLCDEVIKTAKLMKNGKRQTCLEVGKDGKLEEKREDAEVVSNEDDIAELLPTESGFFFGSTGHDKYYLEDVKYTKEILDKILTANMKDWGFEYHSSW